MVGSSRQVQYKSAIVSIYCKVQPNWGITKLFSNLFYSLELQIIVLIIQITIDKASWWNTMCSVNTFEGNQTVPLCGAPGHFLHLEVKPRDSKEEKTLQKNTRNKLPDVTNNPFYLLKQFLHSLTDSLRETESSGKKLQNLPPSTPAPKLTHCCCQSGQHVL